MTFFRYFPAKEDVAMSDSYDPLIAGLLGQTPAGWPLTERIRAALLQGLRQLYDTDRDTLLAQNKLIVSTPALRERLWASQMDTQQLILQALRARPATTRAPASRTGSPSRPAWPPPPPPSSPGSRTTEPPNYPT